MPVIAAGQAAPELSLERHALPPFTRADLAGRTTLLVFYPFAFSPVCTSQLGVYQEVLGDLAEHGVTVYGVSCDATYSQTAFKEKLGITIDQLSDFEPKGAASEAFGVRHPGGFSQRALVILGADGVVRWSYEADSPGELPGPDLLAQGVVAAFGDGPAA
jgi:peroxiredoxin (alkyl hydroperoxide reductase subunit C)